MAYKIGLYPERWESIENLSLEDKGKILDNIFYYSTKGEIPHNGYIEAIFRFMKNRIDADKKTYDDKCKTNREVSITYRESVKKPNGIQTVSDGIQTIPNSNSNSNSNKEINTTIVVDTLKKKTPNLEINFLIEEIKKFNNGIIDGTQKEQRQYGNLLLKKLEQIKINDYDWKSIFSMMLEIISKNTYHSHKIVGPKKIYYELSGLLAVCKQDIERQQKSTIPFIPGI